MKVEELIEELKQYSPLAVVVDASGYEVRSLSKASGKEMFYTSTDEQWAALEENRQEDPEKKKKSIVVVLT